jgi:aminopeptidase N
MRNTILIFLALVFFILVKAQDRTVSYKSSGGRVDPLQAIMDIRHYTIALDVDIPQQMINGYAIVDIILSQKTDTLLFNLVQLMVVKSVTVNTKTAKFFQKGDFLIITNENGFTKGKQSIKIDYGGKPPVATNPPWEGGFSWKKDANGNPWVVINCQSEGADVYFPCKDHPGDEPNEGADLIITVPKGLSVAGPGLLQSVKRKANDKTTFHWKTNYTISNYCIVFNIAKYKVVSREYTTVDGNKVPMQFYVLEEDTAYASHVLDIKERDTRILEKYFGEYPWVKEKIGLAEVSNPGMEHQTMITYGDKFKYKKVGGQDYSDNLFHEYSHEWWANKVTNKDWAHMWIQEGIATYSEALFFKEAAGENAYDSIVAGWRIHIRNKQPIVLGEEVKEEDTYNGDIYGKGAFFMHTLRHVMGDSIFFPALKELATNKKYTYDNFVTTTDVQDLFSSRFGKDLKPLFDFYLRTTGILEIHVVQSGWNEYAMQAPNCPMLLPVDIITDEGTKQIMLDNKVIKIKSKTPPVVDAKGNYFKRVTSL